MNQTTSEPRFTLLPIESIELLEDNPRTISAKEFKALRADIRNDPDFLIQRPPLINLITRENRNICYAGTQRIKAAKAEGKTELHCWVQDDVPKELQDERMLKDNLHRGQWDFDKLLQFDFSFLESVGMDLKVLAKLGTGDEKAEARQSLKETFIMPPFSILDARQGHWQDRKTKWFNLGIVSDGSREDMEAQGSLSGSVPGYYKKKKDVEKALKRKIENDEFERDYLPELMNADSHLSYTTSGAVLSIFDPVLCEIIYTWFTAGRAEIFDPFAGGSVRGIVAKFLGHKYTGIDLRKEQVEENYRNAKEVFQDYHDIDWITGDSLKTDVLVSGKLFDLVFSCPPYFDLEKYSKDKNDLSNQTYEDFAENYTSIIAQAVKHLKEDCFACFVIANVRDKKTGFYRDLVSLTIEAFEKAEAYFYNDIILINQAGSAPIRSGRQFKSTRKVSKMHQNVLVFYKGDPKNIKGKFESIIHVKNLVLNEDQPNITLPT